MADGLRTKFLEYKKLTAEELLHNQLNMPWLIARRSIGEYDFFVHKSEIKIAQDIVFNNVSAWYGVRFIPYRFKGAA